MRERFRVRECFFGLRARGALGSRVCALAWNQGVDARSCDRCVKSRRRRRARSRSALFCLCVSESGGGGGAEFFKRRLGRSSGGGPLRPSPLLLVFFPPLLAGTINLSPPVGFVVICVVTRVSKSGSESKGQENQRLGGGRAGRTTTTTVERARSAVAAPHTPHRGSRSIASAHKRNHYPLFTSHHRQPPAKRRAPPWPRPRAFAALQPTACASAPRPCARSPWARQAGALRAARASPRQRTQSRR